MTIATEVWRDIEDWEGLYQVSNLGRVRSLDGFQFNKDGTFIRKWINTSIAGDTLGISKTSITKCLSGISKTAFGCVWKYESEVKNVY